MSRLDRTYSNQILHCDCVEGMRRLPAECIPCTVTSPPYDRMRIFGGHRFDFEAIAAELYRITMPGGVMVWIVQDAVVDGGFSGSKYRQALHFMDLGFKLWNEITMQVITGRLPHKVRYTPNSHTAYVLSKGRPRTVNLIKDKPNRTAGKFKSRWHSRQEDGRRFNGRYGKTSGPFGERSDVWPYLAGKNHTTKDDVDHPALMPEAMAADHIFSWSRPGDLIFDPLCGGGTTCKMALLSHRRYLGMEIHEPFWQETVKRLAKAQQEYRDRLDAEWRKGVA